MDSASEIASESATRRAGNGIGPGLALILAAGLAAQPGCARMRSERQFDDSRMLGRRPEARGVAGPAAGAFAASDAPALASRPDRPAFEPGPEGPQSRPPRAEEPPALVRSTAHPASRSPLGPSPARVRLQPPVDLAPPVEAPEVDPGQIVASDTPAPRPAAPEPAPAPAATAASIVAEARKRLDAIGSYQVDMRRQERIGDAMQAPEDLVVSIRREPKAVRLEWPAGPNKGREVIYEAARGDDQMHINQPGSLVPRVSLGLDNPLVARSSRHPITEAGFDTIIQNMERALEFQDKGDPQGGEIRYAGVQTPEDVGRPCDLITRVTPEGDRWSVFLDRETRLPTKVEADDSKGQPLERYLFLNPRLDVAELASAEAFDPERRWGPSTGLLGRLARSPAPAATPPR